MHIVIATDADWIVDEVTAAVGGPETTFTVVREGRAVSKVVAERDPDLVIADLQVGTMGGMAITMALHLDESAGALAHVPVLMLLDRAADVYLAQRAEAESWLVKPLDAFRLQRAVRATLAGELVREGLPPAPVPAPTEHGETAENLGSAEEEPATAG